MYQNKAPHTPVLLNEVLEWFCPAPEKIYVDATLGAGGHSEAVLQRILPSGRLVGMDQDPAALAMARERLLKLNPPEHSLRLIQGNFAEMTRLLAENNVPAIDGGILADLGVSSMQLDMAERGFSFNKDGPLDMRMQHADGEGKSTVSAQDFLETAERGELVRVFRQYGEEPLAKPIAEAILRARKKQPLSSTMELAQIVSRVYERIYKKPSRLHPATRVFQAIRMEVNQELPNLARFLEQLPDLLAPGGRVVIISFHSLEDRIVKQFFKRESTDCLCPPKLPACQCGHQAVFKRLTKKPVLPGEAEIAHNPRARSAKLRAVVRL